MLEAGTASGSKAFWESVYLTVSTGWKSPSPDPNTGLQELLSAGWRISTVMGGALGFPMCELACHPGAEKSL